MTKNILAITLSAILSFSAVAQQDVYLHINHMLDTEQFAFNQASVNDLGHDFSIDRIDYYLSKLTIIHDGGMETEVSGDLYILAKGNANVAQLLGNLNVTEVEGIKFSVGVDSPTNNEDPSQWAWGHPLAPQNPSMHWGWAAGYRFVAIEGVAGASLNTTFQMHGIGNDNYFEQTVMAEGYPNGNEINIFLNADYTAALKGINLSAGPIDHGVNATDLTVLENFRDYVFSPGANATAVDEKDVEALTLFPNPSNGKVQIKWNNTAGNATDVIVYDIAGRIVKSLSLKNQMEISININQTGLYFVQVLSSGTVLANSKLIIK